MKKTGISKVTLKIKGKEVEITLDEARMLLTDLQSLFGNGNNFWVYPPVIYPSPYTQPQWPINPPIVWTSNTDNSTAQ